VISELSKSDLQGNCRENIAIAFHHCRAKTLELLASIDEEAFRCQPHDDFSPAGWHLGHIAYTESLWLLERSAGNNCIFPEYRKLFAADGLPKYKRVQLPSIEETRNYLQGVRNKVLDYLQVADISSDERLWWFLLQHESQHCETVSFVLELANRQLSSVESPNTSSSPPTSLLPTPYSLLPSEMIEIPGGEFEMGSNTIDALDNERSAHRVYLDTYFIDRYPVTCGQYRKFMAASGYQNRQWWSDAGWTWLQSSGVTQPLYWQENTTWENHPVCGVSYYEAEAYASFVGKRLPTEAEWEKAARWDVKANRSRKYPWGEEEISNDLCNYGANNSQTTPVNAYPNGQSASGMYDALGNVWEWTNTWFDAYNGFEYYPYTGYSQIYFDREHRVLKGSSWVTRPWAMRTSFRNWYHPHVRQIFAGFRCVN
jgi:gamma-glutamyl hercynylcysteine S-oxide synthase